MKPGALVRLCRMLSLTLLAAGCDGLEIAPAAGSIEVVAPALSADRDDADPDDDPFVRAVAQATSIFSDAGIAVRDSEWGFVQQGILASELEPARFRQALDALFLVAPYPAIYPDVRLPREMEVRGAFVATRRSPSRAGRDPRWVTSEPAAIYALPETVRFTVNRLAREGYGTVIHIAAVVLREPAGGAPVAAEVTIAWSSCGWCMEGMVFTIDGAGALIDQRSAQAWSAHGYCC